MQKNIFLFITLSFFLFSAFEIADTIRWNIADDFEIRFKGKSAKGTFGDLQGTLLFDPNTLTNSKMEVSVDVNTISTGNNLKDKHAKSSDWFDAEQYPSITFQSKDFLKTKYGYEVKGALTLHGKTKDISIPFSFEQANGKGTFVGSFKINREDYGIKGPWLRSAFVGKEFEIDLRVPVSK